MAEEQAPVQPDTWELKVGHNGGYITFTTSGDKDEATRVANLFLTAVKETNEASLAVMVTNPDSGDHFIVE